MLPYYGEVFGNPSSVHGYGQEAKAALDLAREQVASLLKRCPRRAQRTASCLPAAAELGPSAKSWTGGGHRKATTWAIRGIGYSRLGNRQASGAALPARPQPDDLVTSQIEHHAVLHTCQFLEKRGLEVTYLPVNREGVVDPEQVAQAGQQAPGSPGGAGPFGRTPG